MVGDSDEPGSSVDVLFEPSATAITDVLIIALGPLAAAAVEAAQRCAGDGISVRVVAPTWISPLPVALVTLAERSRLVVTAEDGGLNGGFGASYARAVRQEGHASVVLTLGLEQEFLPVGKRAGLLTDAGLDAAGLHRSIAGAVGSLESRGKEKGSGVALGSLVDLNSAGSKSRVRTTEPVTRSGPS